MTFQKPDIPKETKDDYQRLLCSVPGCQNRWTIDMGSPKCSLHQWGATWYKPKK